MASPTGDTSDLWTSVRRTEVLRRDAGTSGAMTAEQTELLVKEARIEEGLRVLDLACGPGDPSLTIARRVGPSGSVVGFDLSLGALEVARERATEGGIRNATFQAGDATELPFPAQSFDRIVSRFGVMFFENLQKALREMHRVMKPGGRVSLMVWGPFGQPYFQSTVGLLMKHAGITEMPPIVAMPFRYAEAGQLETSLGSAGFTRIRSGTHTVNITWKGTPESFRDNWRANLVYWRKVADDLQGGDSSPAWSQMADSLRPFYDGIALKIPTTVRVINAQ